MVRGETMMLKCHDLFAFNHHSGAEENMVLNVISAKISRDHDNIRLSTAFTKEEVEMTIMSVHPTKAPFPSGVLPKVLGYCGSRHYKLVFEFSQW